jgi:multisubunit Na+/H+ antiporter MnhF subunit
MMLTGLLLSVAILLVLMAFYTLRGVADRMVAADMLSACVLGSSLLAAGHTGSIAFLDVALGFGAITFVGTITWAYALTMSDEKRRATK